MKGRFIVDMKCVKCRMKAGIDLKHLGGSLCQGCFAEVIEKRARKAFREHDWLRPKDKALIIDDGSIKAKVCIFLTKNTFKGQPFYFSIKKGSLSAVQKLAKGHKKAIIPWNMDDEIELNLRAVFEGNKPEKMPYIKPLLNISDEEIHLFAKAKGIKGREMPKTQLGRMLDELEKRYPGSKFGLLRSFCNNI